jgi:hypothetical protein
VDWSGGGTPASQDGGCTFTTNWDTSGVKTVTASIDNTNGCSSSKEKQVTVVKVESLLPSEGTEIDDGDGDARTKSYVVCITPTAGTVTVTATPSPTVAEEDLPSCWTLTGGTGSSKLTRTVDKTSAGVTTITCTAGTDVLTTPRTTKIYVVKGEVSLAWANACDGEGVNVDLELTPANLENELTTVVFSAVVPTGTTNFGSPSGQGLTFSQRGNITQWEIDNARWYSNQANHCNGDADWEVKAIYTIAGTHNCSTDYDPATADVFTASAAFGTCIDGGASVTNLWSGVPTYTTVFNGGTGLWETTVTQGTFVRDVQATSWWLVPANSQYHDMVRDEEQFHEGQYEGTTSAIFSDLWDPQLIMNAVNANEPYVAGTEAASLQAAVNAFNAAWVNEQTRSSLLHEARLCPKEQEAKTAAGSSHRVAMPCTYPACP